MGVSTRNMYSCLEKYKKLNKSHLFGQLLNSIYDARTHVYKKKPDISLLSRARSVGIGVVLRLMSLWYVSVTCIMHCRSVMLRQKQILDRNAAARHSYPTEYSDPLLPKLNMFPSGCPPPSMETLHCLIKQ